MDYRIEHDSMGEVKVPADRYWAAQTQRSHENFRIGEGIEIMPREITKAFGVLKKAAALANHELRPEKMTDKKYYRHSGFPGGLTELKLEEVIEKDPSLAIREAVKGMLPKNKLAADRLARLRIFDGAEHAHTAQNPKEIK